MTEADAVALTPTRHKPPFVALIAGLLVGLILGLAIPHPLRWTGGVFFPAEPGPLQQGTATVPPNGDLEIFYALPYQNPPQLEFPNGLGNCTVLKQSADGFQLKNAWGIQERVSWQANGQLKP